MDPKGSKEIEKKKKMDFQMVTCCIYIRSKFFFPVEKIPCLEHVVLTFDKYQLILKLATYDVVKMSNFLSTGFFYLFDVKEIRKLKIYINAL